MKFPDGRSQRMRHAPAVISIGVLLCLCLLFFRAAQLHHAREDAKGSAAIKEATSACLTMQSSPGDFSAVKGYSDIEEQADFRYVAPKIELDEANSNHTFQGGGQLTTTVVVGRVKSQPGATDWLKRELQNITSIAVYIVDDPHAQGLHLERNHGRESIVYLKYIIDNYDRLNDITFFFHPARYTWHNNLLMKEDSAEIINKMSRSLILQRGYVNSRCDAWPGCPSWITYNPSSAEHSLDVHRQQDKFNPELFSRLFPDRVDIPRYFGQPCCSQFAASRDAIHRVGKETFQRLYDWVDSVRSDWNSGRMMEMLWQYVFLDRGVVCPSMEQCYCETYGVCYQDDPAMLRLVDTWNDYRSRTDGLAEQVSNAETKLRDKIKFLHMMDASDPTKQANAQQPFDEDNAFRMASQTDPEILKVRNDYEHVKSQSKKYKEILMRKWGVEKSNEWF